MSFFGDSQHGADSRRAAVPEADAKNSGAAGAAAAAASSADANITTGHVRCTVYVEGVIPRTYAPQSGVGCDPRAGILNVFHQLDREQMKALYNIVCEANVVVHQRNASGLDFAVLEMFQQLVGYAFISRGDATRPPEIPALILNEIAVRVMKARIRAAGIKHEAEMREMRDELVRLEEHAQRASTAGDAHK